MSRLQTYHLGPRALLGAIAGTLAFLGWRRWRPFRVAVVGRSMGPGLLPGDFVVAAKARRLHRGDVVVVEHPGRPGFEMVKRLAGLPGEPANGRPLAPDEHWVLGDDAEGSTDSRVFGPVGSAAILGVVRFRYWPLERAGLVRRSFGYRRLIAGG